jgi:Myb-like DNA-binding domain
MQSSTPAPVSSRLRTTACPTVASIQCGGSALLSAVMLLAAGEEARLRAVVERHTGDDGVISWVGVAAEMPGRTDNQVMRHWKNQQKGGRSGRPNAAACAASHAHCAVCNPLACVHVTVELVRLRCWATRQQQPCTLASGNTVYVLCPPAASKIVTYCLYRLQRQPWRPREGRRQACSARPAPGVSQETGGSRQAEASQAETHCHQQR